MQGMHVSVNWDKTWFLWISPDGLFRQGHVPTDYDDFLIYFNKWLHGQVELRVLPSGVVSSE